MQIRTIILAAGAALSLLQAGQVSATTTGTGTNSDVQVLNVARLQAPNGRWFDVTKQIVGGQKQTIYRSGELVLTNGEYNAWTNANPPSKVDSQLQATINAAQPGAMLPVAIWLAVILALATLASIAPARSATRISVRDSLAYA